MHKDPYENIYCVVSGEKEFILHPPTDLPWIPYEKFHSAVYKEIGKEKWITEPPKVSMSTDSVNLEDKEEKSADLVPWIVVDPLNPDYEK